MNKDELKALRLRLGLSQTEMGLKLGIGLRQYQYAESGKQNLSTASVMLAEQLVLIAPLVHPPE